MKKQILPILCTMLMMLLLPFKMEASDSVSLKHSQTSISGIEYRVKQLEDVQREHDPTIPHGKMIISNVIKAEILYKGEQIQRAKVDIKFNY